MREHWTIHFDHTLSTLTCVREGTRGYTTREVSGPWTIFYDREHWPIAVRLDDATRATSLVPLTAWVPDGVVSTSRQVLDLAVTTRTDLVMSSSVGSARTARQLV